MRQRQALQSIARLASLPKPQCSLSPRVGSRPLQPIPLAGQLSRVQHLHTSPLRWRNAYTSDRPHLPPPPSSSSSSSTSASSSESAARKLEVGGEKQSIGKVEPRLSLTFTCTAPIPISTPSSSSYTAEAAESAGTPYSGGTATTDSAAPLTPPPPIADVEAEAEEKPCGHRSTHEFSKKSYENGIVLIQCPSCKSRHLIADHLGWFKESTEDGRYKNVEDLLRAKGEKITRGRVNFDGDVEYDGSS